MIVNTAVVFKKEGNREIPGFLLMSDDIQSDLNKVGHLRAELILESGPREEIFLTVSLPDRQELLARSQPFPDELRNKLHETLGRAPSDYQVLLCDKDDTSKTFELLHGGDDPLDPSGETARGYRLLNKQRWAQAVDIFRKVIKDRPSIRGVRTLAGRALSAMGHDKQAERMYLEELDLAPNSYLALNNLGTLYKRWGWMEHAFNCYVRALDIYPNSYETLINFSTVLFYFGDLGGVRIALARAHKVNPSGKLVDLSLSALADKIGMTVDELRSAVEKLAESIDLKEGFAIKAQSTDRDLKKEEAFRCFVEEAFRDGVLETWEREILGAAARILKVPVELQCRIVVETQKRYWRDQLPPEGPLDKLVLYRRLYGLADRDGVIKQSEQDLLDRVAALLKLTPEQIEQVKKV